jgi:hypothetical protein
LGPYSATGQPGDLVPELDERAAQRLAHPRAQSRFARPAQPDQRDALHPAAGPWRGGEHRAQLLVRRRQVRGIAAMQQVADHQPFR